MEKLTNIIESILFVSGTQVAVSDIAEKLKVARSFGDLSENSEYDEAKNEQAKIEARIVELEKMLENVSVIDENINTDVVTVGANVVVLDVEYDEELTYRIVGSAEANPMQGYLSDDSPVGSALLGAKVGEEVIATTPAGELKFKIISISK